MSSRRGRARHLEGVRRSAAEDTARRASAKASLDAGLLQAQKNNPGNQSAGGFGGGINDILRAIVTGGNVGGNRPATNYGSTNPNIMQYAAAAQPRPDANLHQYALYNVPQNATFAESLERGREGLKEFGPNFDPFSSQGVNPIDALSNIGNFASGLRNTWGQITGNTGAGSNPADIGQQNFSYGNALNELTGGNPYQFNFNPIRQQAVANFKEQTLPSIAQRFSSLGTGGGGQRSSGFAQALGAAGAGLNRDLGALEQQYGIQGEQLRQSQQNNAMNLYNSQVGQNQAQQGINLGNLQNAQQYGMQQNQFGLQQNQFNNAQRQQQLANNFQGNQFRYNAAGNNAAAGLTPQVGNQYFAPAPAQTPWWKSLLGLGAQAVGTGLGAWVGGPAGAAAGNRVAGSLFS